MAPPRPLENDQKRPPGVPPRPGSPKDYVPTPIDQMPHADTLNKLRNAHQSPDNVVVHSMSRDRFQSFSQLTPPSPTKSTNISAKSKRSIKSAFEKTLPAVGSAIQLGKVAANIAQKTLTNVVTKSEGKMPDGFKAARQGKGSRKPRLPRLVIPKPTVAAEDALTRVVTTETMESAHWTIERASPTTRGLRHEITEEHHSEDVVNELRNIITARRRVRKSPFGRRVDEYRERLPHWQNSSTMIATDYNSTTPDRDCAYVRYLVGELDDQKDEAGRLAVRQREKYPLLRFIKNPRCSEKVYWQHKSRRT
ncbi:hypothetical protein F5Y15DRAFT_105671 [Xylariaceae sp. FL0016]|nr:hypothetical protein F5Y15DRAFT_105671 [Xylariaceae sp. FL0016]